MATLGIHNDFVQDLVKLEKPVQQKVANTLTKFGHATHTGIHLEKIDNIRDPRLKSIRIDQSYRGIVLVPDSGDHFTLLKVMNHDDAYDWARRRRVSVNAVSGEIELRDVVMIEDTTTTLADKPDDPSSEPIFARVSDADLTRLGVDEQIRGFARLLHSIEPLEALHGRLPQPQYDVLIGLAAGYSVDEVWEQVAAGAQGPHDTEDIVSAVERTPAKVALVEGPDELMALLAKPFALWRVYLHPTQHAAAYGSYRGPAQVTGGPGTGKTVVALHRARHLAAKGGRVLLTTFTGTLADSLLDNLRLLESDEEILSRIDVRTVDSAARKIVSALGARFAVLKDAEEQGLWRRIIRRRRVDFTETFVAEEWRQIVLAQNLTTLDEYLAARRTGRGKRLGPLQRTQIWHVITEFLREMSERNHKTFDGICVEAAEMLTTTTDKPYDHVIVDEAQDLHPVRWRLLRALVAEGDDDLFIAADTHQRIYDNRVSLRAMGIHVAGRSMRLTVNYRTTSEILSWSHRILAGEEIQDLDEGAAKLDGFRSELHGAAPETFGARTKVDEFQALTAKVRSWLDSGVSPAEIGVAARSTALSQEAARALSKADIDVVHLGKERVSVEDRVQTMTMHRMKGLEFRCVAVIGAGAHLLPDAQAVRKREEDELAHEHDLQRERCLLFVACTRAREALYVSWPGEPSQFLP